MPKNVDDKIKGLSPAQRKKVEARVKQLIAEETASRESGKSGSTSRQLTKKKPSDKTV